MTNLSLAVGTINKEISAEELIQNMINEAEGIIKSLGLQGDTINFIR